MGDVVMSISMMSPSSSTLLVADDEADAMPLMLVRDEKLPDLLVWTDRSLLIELCSLVTLIRRE